MARKTDPVAEANWKRIETEAGVNKPARPKFEDVTEEAPEPAEGDPVGPKARGFKLKRVVTLDERTTYKWKLSSRSVKRAFGQPIEWANVEPGEKPNWFGLTGHRVRFAKRLGTSVPLDMREAVEEAARTTGQSMAEIIRQAILTKLTIR